MSQNIYDNEGFFDAYARLPRSRHGLEAAPEFPSLSALLPPLAGARVLDLGCGYGWFCRWARAAGAAAVLGLDLSERMLARARESTADAAIVYRRADLESPDLPPAAFDLAYSSLALHYVADLPGLLRAVHRALVPDGRLVVSVEHPMFTASHAPGWLDGQEGRRWLVDHYLDEGPRETNWLAPGVIKQHRMIGTYVALLLANGFTLMHLEEWGPSEAQVAAEPAFAAERERPPFLLLAAARQEAASEAIRQARPA